MQKTDRAKAREIYIKHNGEIPLIDIAKLLKRPHGTIRSWKHADNWDNDKAIPQIDKDSPRYKAMKMYLVNNREITMADIANKLNLPHGTIRSWKYRDEWDKKYLANKEWLEREETKKEIDDTIKGITDDTIKNILNEINIWSEALTKLKDVGENKNIDTEDFIYENITKTYNTTEDKEIIRPILKSFIETLDKTEEFQNIKERKHISEYTRYKVLEKAGFKCQACGRSPRKSNDVILHIDHIVPHSLGGSDNINNLQVLCDKCNTSKGNDYDINHNIDWRKRA